MTAMTRKQEALLRQLVAVAGDPEIVEEALRTLNEESGSADDMKIIVRRILEIRLSRNSVAHSAAQ
jgi:hypothetical protein